MIYEYRKISALIRAKANNPNIRIVSLSIKDTNDAELATLPTGIEYHMIIKNSNFSAIPSRNIESLEIVNCHTDKLNLQDIKEVSISNNIGKISNITATNCRHITFTGCHDVNKMSFNNVKNITIEKSYIEAKKIPVGDYDAVVVWSPFKTAFDIKKGVTAKRFNLNNVIVNGPSFISESAYLSKCDVSVKKFSAKEIMFSKCKINSDLCVNCDTLDIIDCKNVAISSKSIVRRSFTSKAKEDINGDFLSNTPIDAIDVSNNIVFTHNKKVVVDSVFRNTTCDDVDFSRFVLKDGVSITIPCSKTKNIPNIVYNRLTISVETLKHLKNIVADSIFVHGNNDDKVSLKINTIITNYIGVTYGVKELTISAKTAYIMHGLGGRVKLIHNGNTIGNSYTNGKIIDNRVNVFELLPNNKYFKGYVVADFYVELFTHYRKIGKVTVFVNKYSNTYIIISNDGVCAHGTGFSDAKKSFDRKVRLKIADIVYKKYTSLSKDTKVSRDMAITMYKEITGACDYGVSRFVEGFDNSDHSLAKSDSFTVQDIIDVTTSNYGNETFAKYFEK